ncbi:MAG: discoidin domain-containing protein [Elusimicrobia bacterium]|nr:discoidin domain-containing protein [Elusimicrobiota bacterium]
MKTIITILFILLFHVSLSAGYIRSWYVCGPFQKGTMDEECFKNEGSIVAKEGRKSGGERWRLFSVLDDALNFDSPDLFGPNDNCNGFAYVEVVSPREQEAVLLAGSDDGVRIWVNGDMVLNNDIPRGLTLDEDSVNIKLKKGKNRLLFKVNDLGGGWNLSARITDHEENDIKDLKYIPDVSLEFLTVEKVFASSVEKNSDYEPEKAFDGDPETRWSSEHSDPQWIIADLGKEADVSEIYIKWETAAAKSYTIDVSSDKKKWKTVYSTDDEDGGEDKIKIKPQSGRYVRLSGKERLTPYGYSIFEFKITGLVR